MASLSAIYNDMQLSVQERGGTQVSAKPGVRPRPDATTEHVLGKAMQRHRHKAYLSMAEINLHLNSKLRDQQHVC